MKIAIDITPLESNHSARGIGRYTKDLIAALQKYRKEHSYNLFTREHGIPKNADLVHYPYFDPFFLTLPVIKTKPVVVTVHDLIPLVFPKHFPVGLRGSVAWQIQKLSLTGAKRIITDSEASKKDVHRIVGFDEKKIDVVYLAPSPVYVPQTDARRLDSVRAFYRLPAKFILYVGDVNWNKNIPGLLRALSHVRLPLVLVGKAFLDNVLPETQEINKLIHDLKLESLVYRPGYVEEVDLAALYCLASCLVQPSFYEGFGLPVLEAMVCGCPVVTSGVSSLSEIKGPAVTIEPESTESIVSGIRRVVNLTPQERKKYIDEQHEWVSRFSWKKVAKETVQSYEKVLERV